MRGMMRAVAAMVAVGMSLVTAGLPPAGADPQAVLPLSAVHAGMRGYGLTVVHGTTVQRFDINVLGVLKGEGGTYSDLILFRAGGPLITGAGGTASGMSGSPIYLNGRLAGALSYGYHFPGPDADLSLATPIEQMLKTLAAPAPAPQTLWPREYRSDAPIATSFSS